MGNSKCFFAVDLGATSGRTIVGTLSDGKIKLEEITRFPNNLIETGGQFLLGYLRSLFRDNKRLEDCGKT